MHKFDPVSGHVQAWERPEDFCPCAWATAFGLGGYALGDNVHRLTGPVGIGGALLGASLAVGGTVWLRRNEQRLAEEAERALPGPFGGGHPHDNRRPTVDTAVTAASTVKARPAEAKG